MNKYLLGKSFNSGTKQRVYSPSASNFCPCKTGLKILKYGEASAPEPATHCQLALLLARSASTKQSQNQSAPWCQCNFKFLIKNDPTIIRTRLCI
ncbi:MAG: hypothetical protein Q8S21_03625 [Candidatus Paracaedibacteraceae bacterium]|nr:hypothetical protein [Candidatus Paracaedibacteraceae bacterium]